MQTHSRPTPTLAEFKQFARDIAPAAKAVLMMRAFVEVERARVDAYILPIFQSYGFVYSDLGERCGLTGPILDMKDLYLADLDDPRMAAFHAECDRAHRAHGFTGPQGHCPALTAETRLMETERAFLDLAEPVFGISADRVYGEERKKYLALLIGAALKDDTSTAREILGEHGKS
jgi:hypothetical protein